MLNNNINFGFVILHYNAIEMTKKCVETLIETFPMDNNYIVIVDNASKNNTGTELENLYKNNSYIKVILSQENLGFAKGNNLGYCWLKNNYECNFIIIMNNDLLINQKTFLSIVNSIYNETQFAVLGPDIYCPAYKAHQNPLFEKAMTQDELLKRIEIVKKFAKNINYFFFREFTHKVKLILLKLLRYNKNKNSIESYKTPKENWALHGSIYILSKNFIKNRLYAFNPETYMYCEEEILHYECLRDGLKMFYSPLLHCTHLQKVSSMTIFKNNKERMKFQKINQINSLNVLLKIMSNQPSN